MDHFVLFGQSHLVTLLVIALLAAGWILICGRGSMAAQRIAVTTCAVCVLLSYAVQQVFWRVGGHALDLENTLPLHLCDLASICGCIALLTRRSIFCEMAYFWGLAGTLQGLITPALSQPFPDPVFISFFWKHGFVVITALLLPLGLGWRPRKNALWKIFAITQIYAVVAMCTNFALGTNYGFLNGKPRFASLLDTLPPWPWYILVLELICLVLFYLLRLPFSSRSMK